MAEITRSTRVAVVKTSTDALVDPTSATQYIPILPDFSLTPNFETVDNDELRSSIGPGKSIQGIEAPEGTIPFYVKHSGVEGTAPDGSVIFESVYGSENINATEHDAVSGTAGTATARATLTLDVGEGVLHPIGSGLLIKSATGYEIRNVYSVAGDVLTLAQNLSAPALVGENTGKSVSYAPANEGHAIFSTHDFRSNGGAYQAMEGSRCVSLSYTASAGEAIQWEAGIEGTAFFYNPVRIVSGVNDELDFVDSGGAKSITALGSIVYNGPHDAATGLQSAMNAASVDAWTVIYSDTTGLFTTDSDSAGAETVDWLTTVNSLGATYGYTADDAGAAPHVSDVAIDLSSPQVPTFADTDLLIAKNNELIFGNHDDIVCVQAQEVSCEINSPKTNIEAVCAKSGVDGSQVNDRESEITVTAYLTKYESDRFRKFKDNDEIVFTHNMGEKDASNNWIPGKNANFHARQATISSIELADADGLVVMNLTLTPFVAADGTAEVYLNFM